jgi:hypothetical protein
VAVLTVIIDFLCFKVLAVTGLVHHEFRLDKVAPKDKYFQRHFCGMHALLLILKR